MALAKTVAALATGLLTAGTAVVGITAATAADTTSAHASTASSASSSASKPLVCHPRKRLPAELRADLRTAAHQPAGQRGPALRKVRRDALHGKYGVKGERWAEHRIRARARAVARMPKDLRHDLRAVHKLPADQRPAARKAIRAKVLAGGYGEGAQKRAEKVKAHHAACKAKHDA